MADQRGRRMDRREVLRAGGVLAGAMAAGACTSAPTAAPPGAVASPAATTEPAGGAATVVRPAEVTPARFEALPTCTATPAAAEGPFPNLAELRRADLTEGRPGHPLALGLRVVDADCQPVPGAEVLVWHTDHTGDYSQHLDGGSGKDEGPESTFCRGSQVTDADGIVVFSTIFPGWYDGRAVHVHLTVVPPDGPPLTTQLYFPEDVTAQITTQGAYAEFGLPDTSIAADFLAGDPAAEGTQLVTADREDGEGLVALLNIGIS